MSARIFLHPSVASVAGQCALVVNLVAHGFNMSKLAMNARDPKRVELVRVLDRRVGGKALHERFDGTRYVFRPAGASAAPEVA